MAKTDLSNYNLAELKGLQFDIEKEIKSRQQDEVKKAREQILAIAHDVGVPVSELLAKAGGAKAGAKAGGPKKGGAQQGQARFRNPADASQTWTGRGRQPRWIAEGLEGGSSLDDFRM
jgi:DNA-binding protein H-NS